MVEVKPILFIHIMTSYTWPLFFLLQPWIAMRSPWSLKWRWDCCSCGNTATVTRSSFLKPLNNVSLTFSFMFSQMIHPVTQLVIDKTPVKPTVKTQNASQHWLSTTTSRWSPTAPGQGAQGATAPEPCPKPDPGTRRCCLPLARGCSSCLMTFLKGFDCPKSHNSSITPVLTGLVEKPR